MMMETIRQDPVYANGNYTAPPPSLKLATAFYGIATAGGTLNYQKQAPTHAQADKLVDARLAAPVTADANDFLWQWGSSADYDAAPDLGKIEAALLAINAADDERNPPETGITEAAMKRVRNGRIYLIPAREQTRPLHHPQRQVLPPAAAGTSADRAAEGDVTAQFRNAPAGGIRM